MLCSQALKCSRRGICVLFVTFETIYMNWATQRALEKSNVIVHLLSRGNIEFIEEKASEF